MARKISAVIVIGSSWIKQKAKEAKNGSEWALKVLTDQYYKEVKRANQRARELDKRGINSAAKKGFRSAISEGQFLSQSKKLDVDTMVKNMEIAENFLKAKTSTVTGYDKAFKKSLHSMLTSNNKQKKPFISKPEGMSDAEYEKKMERFFKNKNFEELKKFLGSGIIKDASDAIGAGIPIGRISRLFNEYLKDTDKHDIYEVWDSFTAGEKHL
jgi:hypothetical protein